MQITINKIAEQLKARLKKPLPGNEAHLITRIKTKSEVTFPNTIETAIPAAVLILLFPFKDEIHNGVLSSFSPFSITSAPRRWPIPAPNPARSRWCGRPGSPGPRIAA